MKIEKVEHSEKFSTDDWVFGFGALDEEIAKILTGGLETAFFEEPPSASLPFYWQNGDGIGGPPVEDPLTIDFSLPVFSGKVGLGPTYRLRLRQLALVDLFDEQFSDSTALEEDVILKFISALRKLAMELEEKLNQTKNIS